LDLAIPNLDSDSLTFWFGRGDGTFGNRVDRAFATDPADVLIADFNADGTADLAVLKWVPASIDVLLGQGGGVFAASISHALSGGARELEGARLVRRRVDGRQHLCRLDAAPLKEAMLWTEQFRRNWEARFEALDSLLDEMKSAENSRARRP